MSSIVDKTQLPISALCLFLCFYHYDAAAPPVLVFPPITLKEAIQADKTVVLLYNNREDGVLCH